MSLCHRIVTLTPLNMWLPSGKENLVQGGTKMVHIDYYFATVSPFTYLCGNRVSQIVQKHGATISYKPLDIMGLFGQTGGVPPKDRHPNRQAYRLQELQRAMTKTGLPLNLKPAFWPTNPAPSSYAIIAATLEGHAAAGLIEKFTAACWAEERNIAEPDVIADVLQAEGLDPAIADKHMMTAADTYARNLTEAIDAGAFGAPFFVVETGQHFWGHDRLDDLDAHLAGDL